MKAIIKRRLKTKTIKWSMVYTSLFLLFFAFACEIPSSLSLQEIRDLTAAQAKIIAAQVLGNDSKSDKDNSNVNAGSCKGEHACEDQCDDLFSSSSRKKECQKLSIDAVENMYFAFNPNPREGILNSPNRKGGTNDGNLDNLNNLDSITNAEKIQEGIWENFVEDDPDNDKDSSYSEEEAQYVLYWLTQNPAAIHGVRKRDDLLEALLKRAGRNSPFEDVLETQLTDDDNDSNRKSGVFFNLLSNDPDGERLGQIAFALYFKEACDSNSKNNEELAWCSLKELLCEPHPTDTDDGKYLFKKNTFKRVIIDYDTNNYIRRYIKTLVELAKKTTDDTTDDINDSEDPEDVCKHPHIINSDVFPIPTPAE